MSEIEITGVFENVLGMIYSAKQKAEYQVNSTIIDLYWSIGEYVSKQIDVNGWGKSTVKALSEYILSKEPGIRGYSSQNIWRMKQFYETYKDKPELSKLLRENTWSNNLHIISKTKSYEEKEFYLKLASKEEYHVQVGNNDYYVDLLFYHRELQCLVAIDLKIDDFKPEYMGKMDFYLEALDRDIKKPHENPSVGMILCKNADTDVVEYSLSRSLSQTMIAEYKTKLIDKSILQRKLAELYDIAEEEVKNSQQD